MADTGFPSPQDPNQGRPMVRPPVPGSPGPSYLPPPPGYAPYPYPPPRSGGSAITRILTGLFTSLLMLSLAANVYLYVMVAAQFTAPSETTWRDGVAAERIVIVPINGLIDDSAAVAVRQSLDALRKNPPKAIILRVESGGGSVGASDRIWNELKQFKADTQIPIVASFGSVAASGGYYISALADHIVGEPTGITGSIGVMAPAFTVDGLLEKIGVKPETIVATDSPRKDVANDITRAWTEEDRLQMRFLLDRAHDRFRDIVFQGRQTHLTREEVDAVADGSIYTTQQALEKKLIDSEGYLADAVGEAQKLAGLAGKKPLVTVIKPPQHFSFMGLLGSNHTPQGLSLDPEDARRWLADVTMPRLEYRWAMGTARRE